MKVFEKINQLKETDATMDVISDWAYGNKICPVMFEDGLEIDCDYPEQLYTIAKSCCATNDCGVECLEVFLESEYREEE